MAKAIQIKPEEQYAREYADRLILEQLTELHEVVKPSDIAERLSALGLGLGAVRSLLASNPTKFAYNERRWVPASRLESAGRPVAEMVRICVHRFGGPMPFDLLVSEVSRTTGRDEDETADMVRRLAHTDPLLFLTLDDHVGHSGFVFVATDETTPRALALNRVTPEELAEVEKKLAGFDWRQDDAILKAVEKAVPVSVKALGAVAWSHLSPQVPTSYLLYDWKAFNAELLSIPGFVYAADGTLHAEADAKAWISTAVKLAEKLAPTIEIEESTPLELKPEDVEAMVKRIVSAKGTVTATRILEDQFEITASVKTFPDDLANVMRTLTSDARVWWVGGDRFMVAGAKPELIEEVPAPFQFTATPFLQEDGDPVDAELSDEGLSTSLRKLLSHPLATEVLDEDVMPAPKNMPEQMRLVLKPIHREIGTFPLSQFPTGWFDPAPNIQELVLVDGEGRELQAWLNHDCRLIFGLLDWWLDQAVESGAVFSLTKTAKPNVFEFTWLEQTDPVVYVSNQRMEELREIASRADDMSTYDILREVMAHWPKGADFLTILWEVNVVRRTSRRLLASLLSSYLCFYQRSGSPVWHYDHKKVEQGFDKAKKKYVLARD